MGGHHDQRTPPAGGQEHAQSITPPVLARHGELLPLPLGTSRSE